MELKFMDRPSFKEVVREGFNQAREGEGFEYIVGEVKKGKLKIVFEPDYTHDLIVIDGVNGFGYTLVYEDKKEN